MREIALRASEFEEKKFADLESSKPERIGRLYVGIVCSVLL